jgi:hypothetical protein
MMLYVAAARLTPFLDLNPTRRWSDGDDVGHAIAPRLRVIGVHSIGETRN